MANPPDLLNVKKFGEDATSNSTENRLKGRQLSARHTI